ncbi:hypothetical protein [Actinomadura sp. NPDC048394]|uniref:hypothetical protein n=1 Tax=Actinomadura sp. NPDC048394 TaxID=3158223 RepID=UPI0033C67551
MPNELTTLLAEHEAQRLANEIARQLEHRTVGELINRVTRHWDWWRFKLAADLVRQPIAIAHRILRRDFDCVDVRCEDQWQLDLDAPCKACAQIAEDTVNRRRIDTTVRPSPSLPIPSAEPKRTVAALRTSAPLAKERVSEHAAKARAMLAVKSRTARRILGGGVAVA